MRREEGGDSGEGMEIATSAVSCQRLEEVPVGVQALPVTQVVSVASLSVAQPLQDLQRGQALRDDRPGLRGQAAGPLGAHCHLGG